MAEYTPPYTRSQLDHYVHYIGLPQKYRPCNNPALDYSLLNALHVHQLFAIPYENLDLHYSTHHSVSLHPQKIFDKFVLKGCMRGGYCMENSLFFLWMLQAYGFDVYPTGVRIRLRENGVPQGNFIGLVHIVLICTLQTGEKYVIDVAFGGDGPVRPLLLTENHSSINLGTQEVRFVYEPLKQNPPRKFTTPQRYWIFQYRNKAEAAWNSFYCFTEDEYLTNDYGVMNFFTSSGQTFQKTTVLIIKFIKNQPTDERDAEITGKIMLVNNLVKRNMGGKTEIVGTCNNEAERIQALKVWFGITLTDEEKQGIKGLVTELGDAKESIS